jgi:hypothetical protein
VKKESRNQHTWTTHGFFVRAHSHIHAPSAPFPLGSSPEQWYFWSPVMTNRDTHFSQPQWLILYKNIGENWRIPGPQQPNSTAAVRGGAASEIFSGRARDPEARYHRLSGRAAELAASARAAAMTRTHAVRRPDGTLELPRDVMGYSDLFNLAQASSSADSNVTVYMDTLWMTQVSQAYCVKTEAEKYRRIMSECGADVGYAGCTMGSLYWMANDIWPAATKGSLEYNGRWKVLHHYARRFFAPFLVSAWAELWGPPANRTFYTYISSQQAVGMRAASAVPEGCIVYTMWSWSAGFLANFTVPFNTTTGFGSQPVWTTTLDDVLARGKCGAGEDGAAATNASDCVLSYAAYNASCSSLSLGIDSEPPLDDNWLFLEPLNTVTTMRDPNISITDVEAAPDLGPGAFRITYEVAVLPGPLVWLESLYTGHFDENARLVTSSPRTAVYWLDPSEGNSSSSITPGQMAASLSAWSLWDTSPEYGPG